MIKIYNWESTSQEDKTRIMQRAQADMTEIKDYVAQWLDKIQENGDQAIVEYIQKFDDPNFSTNQIKVTAEEIKQAYEKISPKVLKSIKEQIQISTAFHQKQAAMLDKQWEIETIPGVITGTKKLPIDSAGLYVPAGKAPLPTVAQILTVAASAAGVPRKVVTFAPTGNHYEIIVAANEAGADEIYRVGGIAAIAALTYGTESIKPVCKIVGPGNPYVQAAKLQVFGKVGIDMLSGPSEALIMADSTANPEYLAADILARCEHGPDSAGVLVTNDTQIAEQTKQAIKNQAPNLSRQDYINEALERYSAIIVVDNLESMINFANEYSAEHLEIQTANPEEVFTKIRNAGSVFIGNYAPVAIGDYASGTNHCLPTGNAVKYSSPIGVETFMKNIEFQTLTRKGLEKLQPIVNEIATVEGLDAHLESVNIRLK